jgi:hypothetical protein
MNRAIVSGAETGQFTGAVDTIGSVTSSGRNRVTETPA